jgi:hypothetical protein
MARTEFIRVRVTSEEKKIIMNKALSSYRILSDYMRDCALEKEIVAIPGLEEAAKELRRIGTNLNQMTLLAHQNKAQFFNLDELKREVGQIWQSVNLSLPKRR